MTKLLAQADQQRSASTSVSLGYAIDEWLRNADIQATTRHGYVGYIERTIRPALGDAPVNKLSARMLETLYGELRRCRAMESPSSSTRPKTTTTARKPSAGRTNASPWLPHR
ncbi:N-terminal phage integrase SAM-like domain-containing protein [Amycolatopsis rhizosphaerae]|uniref:N-terminal phage integrase SAM-like domain-containing protein n=1 Tax=Amycolatopsis rhizosphaerae TaxID=2053003 RepID=UPI001FE81F68|nr:N-terminal phage integrase SAM-like domain-containing protein [Amycolatopsis rhizosphaerae]